MRATHTRPTRSWSRTYGDGPADEVDRLLDIFATPESQVLDLGCGAGFTLCRVAPKVKTIWGFDQETELLEAAQAACSPIESQ